MLKQLSNILGSCCGGPRGPDIRKMHVSPVHLLPILVGACCALLAVKATQRETATDPGRCAPQSAKMASSTAKPVPLELVPSSKLLHILLEGDIGTFCRRSPRRRSPSSSRCWWSRCHGATPARGRTSPFAPLSCAPASSRPTASCWRRRTATWSPAAAPAPPRCVYSPDRSGFKNLWHFKTASCWRRRTVTWPPAAARPPWCVVL